MTKANLYPKHSIGEHIIPFELMFDKSDTVEYVLSSIRKKTGSWPNSESIYVVDKENKLTGAIEFKRLLTSNPKERLLNLMPRDTDFLTDRSHQNTAVKLAINKNLESIPIVDQNGHFLGIIDSGQILKIMHEEHVEKLMHFSGILDNESLADAYKAKISGVFRARIPWLLLGLIGGIFSTLVIKLFDHTLEKELSLAFFIPLIVYMNAAVGAQTQTIFVRFSAFEKISFKKSMLYELKVALLVGATIAIGMFFFATIWLGSKIAEIVSLSIFIGVVSSVVIGTFIPWFLQRKGKDPAIGSGPFATIIQDLLSVIIYFSIAAYLL
ncbi:hypothetical protein A2962_03475 [Candidatus Woesebacteria bacterium RIFCSPLOWO2_01_FULL_39_61]|nr:MAG: hypothetical protein A2692_00605 [Candidatus Woesebacteria bacterium RIFCSPHIGHO2_01_FULL_39_95]OGM38710.1 MAG: hypothetical protein A3E13_03795 [Candidatus Woesebacteria bacterium RIFCSPHIGHO2_12_FULL_40_20]OGM67571.1 MAG: hypothetical protein A2962_03475 [Candidatus Woesebacteria bacterium RIFCSPLOWO2_01_FULL_39_61]